MSEVVMLDSANIELEVPDFNGDTNTHRVTWIRQIEGDFFEVALRGLRYPVNDCYTSWLAKIDNGKFTLLSCTMYFTMEECKILDMAEKLHLQTTVLHERIYKMRIKKWISTL